MATRYSPKTGLPNTYQPGPFDSPHLYVQWGGKLPGGEQWTCGFRLRKKSAGVIDSGAGLLVGVSAAIVNYHTSASTRLSQAAKLSFVKVNAIGTDGHYSSPGTNQALYPDTGGAQTGDPIYPNQVTLAVSLTTGFSRGPAHRGRFYLPLPSQGLLATGVIQPAAAVLVSEATDGLVTAVNAVNTDYEVAIFSRKAGTPGNRKVTGNLVGTVLDTQRRRRRSIAENYQ